MDLSHRANTLPKSDMEASSLSSLALPSAAIDRIIRSGHAAKYAHFERAVALLRGWIAAAPASGGLYSGECARLLLRMGRTDEARELLAAFPAPGGSAVTVTLNRIPAEQRAELMAIYADARRADREGRLALGRQLIEEDPARAPAYALLIATELRQLRQVDELREWFTRLPKQLHSAGLLAEVGRAATGVDDELLKTVLRFAEELAPGDPQFNAIRWDHLSARKNLSEMARQLLADIDGGCATRRTVMSFLTSAVMARKYTEAAEVYAKAESTPELRPPKAFSRQYGRRLRSVGRPERERSELSAAAPAPTAEVKAGTRLETLVRESGAPPGLSRTIEFAADRLARNPDSGKVKELYREALKEDFSPVIARHAARWAVEAQDGLFLAELGEICSREEKNPILGVLQERRDRLLALRPLPVDLLAAAVAASGSAVDVFGAQTLQALQRTGCFADVSAFINGVRRNGGGLNAETLSALFCGPLLESPRVELMAVFEAVRAHDVALDGHTAIRLLLRAAKDRDRDLGAAVFLSVGFVSKQERQAFYPPALPLLAAAGCTEEARQCFLCCRLYELTADPAHVSAAIEHLCWRDKVELAADVACWALSCRAVPSIYAFRRLGRELGQVGSERRCDSILELAYAANCRGEAALLTAIAYYERRRFEDGAALIGREFSIVPHDAKPPVADLYLRARKPRRALELCDEFLAAQRHGSGVTQAAAVKLEALLTLDRVAAAEFARGMSPLPAGKFAFRIEGLCRSLGVAAPRIMQAEAS